MVLQYNMLEMFKRWFKKSVMIMLLLCVTLSFSGFSSMNSFVFTKENGVVAETIKINLDVQAIANEGYSISQVAQKLSKVFDQQIEAIKYSYVNPNTITKGETKLEQNIYSCEILFLNESVYQNFYRIKGLSSIQRTEKHFLYSSVYLTTHNVFEKHNELYNKILEVVPGDVKVYSMYQTKYRRVHSDADEIVCENNLYYHVWEIDEQTLFSPVEIYYNVANSGVWIMMGIVGGMVACLILLFVCFVLYKRKQNKLIKLLAEDDDNK